MVSLQPAIAVAIASFRARHLLEASLESILPQAQAIGAPVVVARDISCGDIDEFSRAFPTVRFVPAPPQVGIPRLRALALAQTRGAWAALTEDNSVADPDWLVRLLAASDGVEVVGGAMDNAQRARLTDWGAFFSEYGFFATGGGKNAKCPLITGANVAYRRDAIDKVLELASQGEWENVIHFHLAAAGARLRFAPEARIRQNLRYTFQAFCLDRYEHGRDYARRRLQDEGRRRWLYLSGALVLPLLQTLRVARATDPGNRGVFLRALPFTFAFLAAWSLGEAVGYWRGATSAPEHYSIPAKKNI